MYAQTRPRFILSSERVLGGMEFEPMLTPREKSPLPENFPRGSNPRRCGQRAQTLPTSYSGPTILTNFKFFAPVLSPLHSPDISLHYQRHHQIPMTGHQCKQCNPVKHNNKTGKLVMPVMQHTSIHRNYVMNEDAGVRNICLLTTDILPTHGNVAIT